MPVDSTSIEHGDYEPQTVAYTEEHPMDTWGMREVPVQTYDIFGRKSQVFMTRMNEYQYEKWLKERHDK